MADPRERERHPSPKSKGWVLLSPAWLPLEAISYTVWRRKRSGIIVLSALELAELPDGSGIGPQWHISVSREGNRPRESDVRAALRAFRMGQAEEDNHHPGGARHFWLPVDPAHRVDCQCKDNEDTIVEADGYRWQNPKPGQGECRGCKSAAFFGRPCSIHG